MAHKGYKWYPCELSPLGALTASLCERLAKTSADAKEPPGATSLRSAAVADLLEDTEEKRVDAEAVGGRTVSP